jgi:P2 family phage contractile tail tube protein
MKHGNKTIQYSIYDRSSGKAEFIADTNNVKRPSFEYMTETLKGAGILGEIDMPTPAQVGAMTYEIAVKRTNAKTISLFEPKTQHIETRWAEDEIDSTSGNVKISANKEIVKGKPKSLDLGSVETNAANENTLALEILYYKYIKDGVVLIEIDKLNNVLIINGKDYTKDLREAL